MAELEAALGLKPGGDGAAERGAVVGSLRDASRREYLKKREAQKLRELRDAVEDEEHLFRGQRLTAGEERELEYKRRVLELAEQRLSAGREAAEAAEGYRLPSAGGALGDARTEQEKLDAALQEYRQAFNAYNEAISLEPQSWSMWRCMGDLYSRLNQQNDALDAFQRVTELNPAAAEVW